MSSFNVELVVILSYANCELWLEINPLIRLRRESKNNGREREVGSEENARSNLQTLTFL